MRAAWQRDQKHGTGTLINTVGTFNGVWVHDRMCGEGRAEYNAGGRYEGAFRDDVRNGQGLLVTASGDRYQV
jgi:hypothetical protein